MKNWQFGLFLLSLLNACAPTPPAPQDLSSHANTSRYTAAKSTEAVMAFDHGVEVGLSKPTMTKARELIEEQLLHLFGPMSAAFTSATPKENHQLSNIKIIQKGAVYVASYHYEGTIVVENGPTTSYTITLPRDPKTIYRSGIVKLPNGKKSYPCTDSHYTGEGDFWYFWNPAKLHCPLKEGVHYDKITARLKRLPNTVKSFPDYERLADPSGEIKMSLFFGLDDPSFGRNPLTSSDENAANVRSSRKSLQALGYTSNVLSGAQISKHLGFTPQSKIYLEEFTKKTPRATVLIRLFFGPTGIDESSKAFHYLYKDALETQSVMIYDGHSGLGSHLDIETIEEMERFKIQPSKSQYQIYFFNSCTSYTYYNEKYFTLKSSENLDILANGLETYFSVMHDTNLALIQAIDVWASSGRRTSYQELTRMMDSDNLLGVNGDEDNPTR